MREDDWFVVDPTGGRQRTIKRLLQKKREHKARIERLVDVLRTYTCECPEYIRVNCQKQRCGSRANDVLDELAAMGKIPR
jgi:hypothetical protein